MIYLVDAGGEHVGPFENQEAVERFIKMMALCGENWADHKIVGESGDDANVLQNATQMDSSANPRKSANKLKLVGRRP
ncbi:MAG: hypothetical protein LAP85_24160 [Acidobacteriia bacterium]|nr:hypothetical protein [Terriglobia bacterium]